MRNDLQVQSAALHALVVEIHAKAELAKVAAAALIETCDRLVLLGGKADALIPVAGMASMILENLEGEHHSGYASNAGVEDAAELVARSWKAVGVV